jgi:hypothetical protein
MPLQLLGHSQNTNDVENTMNGQKIFGLVLVAVGLTLLFFGYNASQSVGEKVVEGVTGSFTNQTLAFIIGGIASLVAGLAFTLSKGNSTTTA